ncbi:MAG: protoheme IX farnesyltransferase [Deltaproteobacteria bacterium]|nr:protoheme IX farnesyltransferase [Deltaproteobacteria bacterium]
MILSSRFAFHKVNDFIALVKPRITALVVFTTAAGLWLAPVSLNRRLVFFTLAGTVLLVGAANALNMYIERDIDALMRRTANRPLPTRRLQPVVALWFGIFLAILALAILAMETNSLTAFLGFVAFVSYVLLYTPLKQKSTLALWIGAVPGALPPLMGWTAAMDSINLPGLVLFAILFLWQIPHFLAIAIMHQKEYTQAGIKIVPTEQGLRPTVHYMIRYVAGLLAVSLYPVWLGITGPLYFWTAMILGLGFLVLGLMGLKKNISPTWARNFFLASIVYLPVLLSVLAFNSHHF